MCVGFQIRSVCDFVCFTSNLTMTLLFTSREFCCCCNLISPLLSTIAQHLITPHRKYTRHLLPTLDLSWQSIELTVHAYLQVSTGALSSWSYLTHYLQKVRTHFRGYLPFCSAIGHMQRSSCYCLRQTALRIVEDLNSYWWSFKRKYQVWQIVGRSQGAHQTFHRLRLSPPH